MNTLLCDNNVSFSTVTKWFREFNRWRYSLEYETRSGRPTEVTDEKNVERVQELIKADPRVTYKCIRDLLKISSASMYNILHKYL